MKLENFIDREIRRMGSVKLKNNVRQGRVDKSDLSIDKSIDKSIKNPIDKSIKKHKRSKKKSLAPFYKDLQKDLKKNIRKSKSNFGSSGGGGAGGSIIVQSPPVIMMQHPQMLQPQQIAKELSEPKNEGSFNFLNSLGLKEIFINMFSLFLYKNLEKYMGADKEIINKLDIKEIEKILKKDCEEPKTCEEILKKIKELVEKLGKLG